MSSGGIAVLGVERRAVLGGMEKWCGWRGRLTIVACRRALCGVGI
jgi:hypothetical protein